jgi:hypothetical protein
MCAQISGEILSGGSCKGILGVEVRIILKRDLEKHGVVVVSVLAGQVIVVWMALL